MLGEYHRLEGNTLTLVTMIEFGVFKDFQNNVALFSSTAVSKFLMCIFLITNSTELDVEAALKTKHPMIGAKKMTVDSVLHLVGQGISKC